MSLMTKPGAVIFAKQLERMASFYSEVLLLPVTHAEGDHVVLESDVFQLVMHAIPRQIADTIAISDPPAIREETPIKLFFPVASLADARARAALRGGQLNPSSHEWTARGFRACDGHDPEGNVLQLREPAP